mmetsp:Transcript_2284/g.8967  ORF Transcript_2284/g.8967 Transcript_2284/m.8967 type:complete len:202 (-) Transcript_2284:119-724(-)
MARRREVGALQGGQEGRGDQHLWTKRRPRRAPAGPHSRTEGCLRSCRFHRRDAWWCCRGRHGGCIASRRALGRAAVGLGRGPHRGCQAGRGTRSGGPDREANCSGTHLYGPCTLWALRTVPRPRRRQRRSWQSAVDRHRRGAPRGCGDFGSRHALPPSQTTKRRRLGEDAAFGAWTGSTRAASGEHFLAACMQASQEIRGR